MVSSRISTTANGVEFDAICFDGGSLQTASYIGEIRALELALGDRALNSHFKSFSGVSAGALFAISCACGLRAKDVAECTEEISDAGFQPSLISFWTRLGLDNGDRMYRAVARTLALRGVSFNQTISEFEALYGVQLRIYSVDAITCKGVFMPGHCMLEAAFRCTSAIPFVFTPQFFEGRVHMDGIFGMRWLPGMLPSDQKWLWLRVKGMGQDMVPALDPKSMCIETLLCVILRVIRASAIAHADESHVHIVDLDFNARLPYIIPRHSRSIVRAVCQEALARDYSGRVVFDVKIEREGEPN